MRRRPLTFLLPLALVAGFAGLVLGADGDRTIAYQGRLELDGEPVSGTQAMVFSFYNVPTGGTAIAAALTYETVDVRDGLFSVALGPLPDAVLGADPLYIQVAVGATSADAVVLGARQRIFAVPYAMRGRGDGEFLIDRVARTLAGLTVGGPLIVDGVLQMGVDTGGSGPRSIAFHRDTGDEPNSGKIAYKGFSQNALSIVGVGTSVPRTVRIYDRLSVVHSIELDSGGTINAQANDWCDCEKSSELENTGFVVPNDFSAGQSGADYYQCRDGRFLVGMYFNACDQLFCLEQYKCCRPCGLAAN